MLANSHKNQFTFIKYERRLLYFCNQLNLKCDEIMNGSLCNDFVFKNQTHTSELSDSYMGYSWHKEIPSFHDTYCYIYTFSHFDLWETVHYIHLHPRYLTHAESVSPLVLCVTVRVFTSLRNITFAGSGTINHRISRGTSVMEIWWKHKLTF